MTEKEMLELEKDNYTTIHLHLVGIFWRAYQRSALGFCKEIRPYKMNVRSNKRQRTVVSFLGFPDSALQEILAVDGCVRVDDSHITLPMEYLSDEEVTEMLPAYNDLPEKNTDGGYSGYYGSRKEKFVFRFIRPDHVFSLA
ncbi:MAG: hypothetical protein LUH01_01785 [Parabacteroides gordonii]|nr:hypothetical protein [Parabacteroides gordonii]